MRSVMDEDQKEHAKRRLALLEVALTALERRQEVLETLWESRGREDAADRLRALLGISHGTPPEVVLDMQLERFTVERRQQLARDAADLREALGRG
jgi:DNA gyrase/topoisomerase IV subunit A